MRILKSHPYILSFGIFQTFFSAPGQTFLISLFVTPMFEDLGVSISLFAGIYSAATIGASLFLNPAGRLIDRFSLKTILFGNTVLMAIGCLLVASCQNVVTLFFGFFLIRLFGQGVFLLTSSTTIAKVFHKNRGKALGIITLGYPLSELVYPAIGLFLLASVGWRMTYGIFALSFLVVMLPLQYLLIHQTKLKRAELLEGEAVVGPQRLAGPDLESAHRPSANIPLKFALRHPEFHWIILASCVPPVLMTGLLFHQEALFLANGWPFSLAASGLGAYALCKAVASVAIGPVVDRHGPVIPFISLIIMLGLGTVLAGFGGHFGLVFVYYSIMGAALGMSSPVMNVVWPNLFGTQYLGEIKGFVATFRNGLTALGPLPVALAIDSGVSLNSVLVYTGVGAMLMAIIVFFVYQSCPRINEHVTS